MTERIHNPEDSEKYRHWLASLMMRRESGVWPRFARLMERLGRRRPRRLATTATGMALLLALAGFGARAAPDNAITVVNGQVAVNANGQCSLIEAIANANDKNSGRPHADCAAGNPTGADTINLPANGLFTLNSVHTYDDIGDIGLPWISTAMTINGNGSTIQRNGNAPDFRIMAVGNQGNLTLNNATIRGGYGYVNDRNYYYVGGGGILNQGQLTITGSTIADNRTGSYYYSADGGGIYNTGTLTISGSFIIDNVANGYLATMGGGILSTGNLTILNTQISGNVAVSSRFDAGGGVYSSGTLIIQDSTFQNNEASGDYGALGGGLAAKGSSSISGSTFVGNSVQASYCDYYDDPECEAKGGGIANDLGGVMTITNSTLSGNEAHRYGGGLVNYSDVTIVNTTVTGNQGGGVQSNDRLQSVVARLRRSIVSGNAGNEVHLYTDAGYNNTLIANKHNVFGRNGNAGTIGFNPGSTDIVPTGSLASILNSLGANGGPTWTHALPSGSPAIDRAPNTDCNAAPVNGVDQRGQPRNRNGDGAPSSNECDIGAFEFQPQVVATDTPTATPTPTRTPTPTPTATRPPTAQRNAFLPAVYHVPQICFAGPGEREDNDTQATANGPLCPGGVISGLPDDRWDMFYLDTGRAGDITATLTSYFGGGMQLHLYYGAIGGSPSYLDTDDGDGLRATLRAAPPGRYYIAIYTETPNPAETRRYSLSVSVP
jgi:hypothetical protein